MKVKYKDTRRMVVEFEPSVRTVLHQYGSPLSRHRISFPYTIFLIEVYKEKTLGGKTVYLCGDNMKFYVAKKPLESLKSEVHLFQMPNVFRGYVSDCGFDATAYSVNEMARLCVENFWASPFSYTEKGESGLPLLKKLAAKTEKDLLYWKKPRALSKPVKLREVLGGFNARYWKKK